MLADQFHQAAAGARSFPQLEEISRLLWRAHAEGQIPDVAAHAVSEAIQARRASFGSRTAPPQQKPPTGRRRPAVRSPDRQASLERRRRQAMSGAVPARIAASFTMAEVAVLSVIARMCQRCGTCILPIDAVAALAGVSRTSVQNAMRQARRLGLIEVRERRRRGLPSMTNVITIISPDWKGWLKLGGQKVGFKTLSPTNNDSLSKGRKVEKPCDKRGTRSHILTSSVYVPMLTGEERATG